MTRSKCQVTATLTTLPLEAARWCYLASRPGEPRAAALIPSDTLPPPPPPHFSFPARSR